MHITYHEELYRSKAQMERIADFPVTVCGAGALGGNICETLARMGFGALRLIDRDRVEEHNLSTQPYFRSDIGAFKAKILGNVLFRAVNNTLDVRACELSEGNAARLLSGSGVVIDTFDNTRSRQTVFDVCEREGIVCLHAGMAAGYGEVIWNERYRVPQETQEDICDYPLARNLVLLTAAVACESLMSFVAAGIKRCFTITLSDLSVQPY